MNILEKLLCIQIELKAPKNQYNSFGKYSYRNCEDILEAVKPLCKKYGAVVVLRDKLVAVNERFYVEATATLYDCDKPEDSISAYAYAREEESKKGMDGSQVTGASSSYARKYALNGLFDIDDTKDADAVSNAVNPADKPMQSPKGNPAPLTRKELTELGVTDFAAFGAWVKEKYQKPVASLSEPECDDVREYLTAKKEKRDRKLREEVKRDYEEIAADGDIPF